MASGGLLESSHLVILELITAKGQDWRASAPSSFGTGPRAPQKCQGRFDNMNLNPHNYHKETEKYEDSTLKRLDQRIGPLLLMLSNGQMPIKK